MDWPWQMVTVPLSAAGLVLKLVKSNVVSAWMANVGIRKTTNNKILFFIVFINCNSINSLQNYEKIQNRNHFNETKNFLEKNNLDVLKNYFLNFE